MFTRKLKFTGTIGSPNPEVEVRINDQLVYSGIVGADLEPSPLGNQPSGLHELITVPWEGKAHEDETVSIAVKVTKGEVRIGPIQVDILNNLNGTLPDGEEIECFYYASSPTTGDGRTNILINGTEPSANGTGDVKAWNHWRFNVIEPGTFSCDFLLLLREPILY